MSGVAFSAGLYEAMKAWIPATPNPDGPFFGVDRSGEIHREGPSTYEYLLSEEERAVIDAMRSGVTP